MANSSATQRTRVFPPGDGAQQKLVVECMYFKTSLVEINNRFLDRKQKDAETRPQNNHSLRRPAFCRICSPSRTRRS
jgi:hypothetical protein